MEDDLLAQINETLVEYEVDPDSPLGQLLGMMMRGTREAHERITSLDRMIDVLIQLRAAEERMS